MRTKPRAHTAYAHSRVILVTYRTDIRPTNATLDNYADTIKKRINLQPPNQASAQQFAHLPATRTPPLTTLSYCAVAQKNLGRNKENTTAPKTKKAKRMDTLNNTEHSQETMQTSTTTTTTLNLQNEILTII